MALLHQFSNSAKPDFTYSPLLNEQHSRLRRRLQEKWRCKIIKMRILVSRTKNSPKTMKVELTNLLKSWTLMKEKIWVNTLRTKNGGTCQNQAEQTYFTPTALNNTGSPKKKRKENYGKKIKYINLPEVSQNHVL